MTDIFLGAIRRFYSKTAFPVSQNYEGGAPLSVSTSLCTFPAARIGTLQRTLIIFNIYFWPAPVISIIIKCARPARARTQACNAPCEYYIRIASMFVCVYQEIISLVLLVLLFSRRCVCSADHCVRVREARLFIVCASMACTKA